MSNSDLPRVKKTKTIDAITVLSVDNVEQNISLLRVGSDVSCNSVHRDIITLDFDGNILS